jgi:hypothetical protein
VWWGAFGVLVFCALGMAVLLSSGSGRARRVPPARGRGARQIPPPQAARPLIGITETDAPLLLSAAAPGLTLARESLAALHPAYVRLLVDWARVQPRADLTPDWALPSDGCARGIAPCAPFAGIAGELAAIGAEQRAGVRVQAIVVLFGTPDWAAAHTPGCAAAPAFAQAPSLAAYVALVRSLERLASSLGVDIPWWSPWNEPNRAAFLAPQRPGCARSGPAVAPGAYAVLARALHAELVRAGGRDRVLLGELAGDTPSSPRASSIEEWIAALPADVPCLGGAWAVHAYAGLDIAVGRPGPVRVLESALDARGGCARGAPVWVTETGAGAPHPGRPRPPGAVVERAGCRAEASQLAGWADDPRVATVLQYTFREDPAFPVGLVTPDLRRLYPTYWLWREWGARRAGAPAPALPVQCEDPVR